MHMSGSTLLSFLEVASCGWHWYALAALM
jgi:hypothetical protein